MAEVEYDKDLQKSEVAKRTPTDSDDSGFVTMDTEDNQMKPADVMFKTSKAWFLFYNVQLSH